MPWRADQRLQPRTNIRGWPTIGFNCAVLFNYVVLFDYVVLLTLFVLLNYVVLFNDVVLNYFVLFNEVVAGCAVQLRQDVQSYRAVWVPGCRCLL